MRNDFSSYSLARFLRSSRMPLTVATSSRSLACLRSEVTSVKGHPAGGFALCKKNSNNQTHCNRSLERPLTHLNRLSHLQVQAAKSRSLSKNSLCRPRRQCFRKYSIKSTFTVDEEPTYRVSKAFPARTVTGGYISCLGSCSSRKSFA